MLRDKDEPIVHSSDTGTLRESWKKQKMHRAEKIHNKQIVYIIGKE